MIHYYDRLGNPISQKIWAPLFEDTSYRIVAHDNVGDMLVSTVWLGLDHRLGSGSPLIFETMVFHATAPNFEHRYRDLEMRRYSTEADALAGHAELLDLVRKIESINQQTGEIDDTATSPCGEGTPPLHDHLD